MNKIMEIYKKELEKSIPSSYLLANILENKIKFTGFYKDFVEEDKMLEIFSTKKNTFTKSLEILQKINENIYKKCEENGKIIYRGIKFQNFPEKIQTFLEIPEKKEKTPEVFKKEEINLKTFLPATSVPTNGNIFEYPLEIELMRDSEENEFYDGYLGHFEKGWGKDSARAYKHKGKTIAYSGYLICEGSAKMSVLPPDAPQDVKDVWNKVKDGLL